MDPFEIIKDSSIWYSSDQFAAVHKKDANIRIGIVKEVYRDKTTTDLRYLVEVRDRNDAIELNCRMMRRFGGVYNYEDVIYRGYKIDDKPDPVSAFDAKAGDMVVVAALNGEHRDGIILGGLAHTARKSTVPIDKGPYYQSEFNGVETVINSDGEYSITFKAIPTNVSKLKDKPQKRIDAPKYDTAVGGSFLKFDKTGSVEINDKSEKDLQRIRIDKKEGITYIQSGNISIKLTKSSQGIEVKSKTLTITSDDSITQNTKAFAVNASTSAKINSPKVAIGKGSIELLDQLAKLIDAIGKLKPISPVGPCTPLIGTPEWPEIDGVKSKIKEITGSL